MNRYLAALGLAAALCGGCASKSKSMAGGDMAPPSGMQVDFIRGSYKTAFPDAAVGVVAAVLDDKPYALVAQMDPQAVHVSQYVSFLDGRQKVIANGKIVQVDASGVTVQFDAGARRPMQGDIAVRF